MKNRELFSKDPLGWQLLNEGVTSNNATDEKTLRYELQTFVCEGEYQSGLVRILQGFLSNLGKDQKAVWVSGFYGSGKSHLVKVLRYLWSNVPFEDGTTPRSLANLPDEVTELLKELSNKAKQSGAGLISVGGTLRSGAGAVRLRLLGIVFNCLGLPEKISPAKLWLDLRDEGSLEEVTKAITSAKKKPSEEFDKIYTSKIIQEAYLKTHPDLGTIKNVSEALRSQYPVNVTDISVTEMVQLLRKTLSVGKKLPLTLIVLDEVQQFINSNADISNDVQEAVEACSKELDGRVLFVGTGQAALSGTPALQKLMGRFTTKVHLKDNDVEKVVRTVVLQKKDESKKSIQDIAEKYSGEITRQLKSTKLATKPEDEHAYVADYPILPVRRRFWERLLQSLDSTGTMAQMRTQLRVTHEACRYIADKAIGSVIPADFLYDQLSVDLIQSGEIQKRFSEIIEEQKKKPEGELRSRLCALVYLINKLPRDVGIDDGVRADVDHLADLLVDDLKQGTTELRQHLPALLKELVEESVLMEVDGEFRLQTPEGSAWVSEFQKRKSSISQNESQIAAKRSQILTASVETSLGKLEVIQGNAKIMRKAVIHQGMDSPGNHQGLVVWVRDGFQESDSSVIKDIQKRNVDDATLHVFIPKSRQDELKRCLVATLAAAETLNFKGTPSSREGQEARKAIENIKQSEEQKLEQYINEIISQARVYLSGGSQITADTPKEALKEAALKVLNRLYPKFSDADHANWGTALTKAKSGEASALNVINFQGDYLNHPVVSEILKKVGSGIKGNDIVTYFSGIPFGWPTDAIHAGITLLVVGGHLAAKFDEKDIGHSDLTQSKIGQCKFRMQHPVLTTSQLLKVRKLYLEAELPFKPNLEGEAAPHFLEKLNVLIKNSGGEPPAPLTPNPPFVQDLAGLQGNDLLFKLFENHDVLSTLITNSKATSKKLAPRLIAFTETCSLVGHGAGLAGVEDLEKNLNNIKLARTLLDDPDPVKPILQSIKEKLHQAIKVASDLHAQTYQTELNKLQSHDAWQKLDNPSQESLIASHSLGAPNKPNDDDSNLLNSLNNLPLKARNTETLALATKFNQLHDKAIEIITPKATTVPIPSATITNDAELEAWLSKVKKLVEGPLKNGPVIIK